MSVTVTGTHAPPSPCYSIAASPAAAGLYASEGTPGGPRGDSGVDLRFAEDVAIPPTASIGGLPVLIDLGVRVRCVDADGMTYIPYQIAPRSSISKTPLSLANGVGIIDAGYQGPLKVAVRNHSSEPFTVRRGESLFQLVRPDLAPARVAVRDGDHRDFAVATARGEGGFGSTGAAGAGGDAA